MFTVTKTAAEQIRSAAQQGGAEGMALRVAATRKPDGSVEYVMGFDEAGEEDGELTCEGVRVIIAPADAELLRDVSMDYVEITPGEHRFIFLNPNDPTYTPPQEG